MSVDKLAVIVITDGLRRDSIEAQSTPALDVLRGESVWLRRHRSAAPSVTRVCSATIATGCYPLRHELAGNKLCLLDHGKLRLLDVGVPSFFSLCRELRGHVLGVPTLAQRTEAAGGLRMYGNASPGDAVDVLGLEGGLTAEQAAAIRQALKLDDPWLVQFGDWLSAASHGDLGQSLRFGRSVSDMLLNAIPVTLQLAGWAFVLGLFLALGLSLWAAARQSAFADSLVEGLNAWSIAMPTFCAGVIFILLFCIELHWLPVIGSFVLPAVIMGLDSGGTIVKPLREELKESAALPYVRTAKAKGLAPLRIAVFHILPNAAGILLSLSGLVAGSLVAGTLTMEILFGLPGIGSLALNAIQGRDTPVVLAAVSFIAVSLVLINTAVDALHKLFDPRMTP